MKSNKFNKFNVRAKTISCSCGGTCKLRSRRNHPFGKKSKMVVSEFYKCNTCGKSTLTIKDKGGKK